MNRYAQRQHALNSQRTNEGVNMANDGAVVVSFNGSGEEPYDASAPHIEST